VATGVGVALFGLGFGMVTQILIVAVQNNVDRRELGIATATTAFFRGLGGAVGAAVLGAVFAARAGSRASEATVQGLGGALRSDIIDAVQAVFLAASPLCGAGLDRGPPSTGVAPADRRPAMREEEQMDNSPRIEVLRIVRPSAAGPRGLQPRPP